MTTRHGRPSQVRPRPPSTGRPAPGKPRGRGPAAGRLAAHRRVETTRRLALPFRLLFVAAVVGLSAGVLFAASGGLGKVASALGATVGGFVDDITATPVPSETVTDLSGAPLIEQPDQPYTNAAKVDIVGTIPERTAGVDENRIRLYVAIGEGDPGVVTEVPVGRTTRFVIPQVGLSEGPNAFTATIVSNAGESQPSPVVTYVYDASTPRIQISSPKIGTVINGKTTTIEGVTQGRSDVRITNVSSNMTVTGTSDEGGRFAIVLPIVAGQNDIDVVVTDPAGNRDHVVIGVVKGSGKLTAGLSSSTYSIKLSRLPERVTLSVVVIDPDGRPLEGARVTFTMAAPGVPAVTSKRIDTAGDGSATWSTTIPKGATFGQVSCTAIVQTTAFGDTTARTVITIHR
ncbi:MAG: Ig-like domain-containing protein [Chloroflexota bacterium]